MADTNRFISLIKDEIAQVLESSPEKINEDENFLNMGISSLQAVKVINALRRKTEIDISPAVIFEYQTISELAAFLENYDQSEQ